MGLLQSEDKRTLLAFLNESDFVRFSSFWKVLYDFAKETHYRNVTLMFD
jgi:hypothetical protein